MNDAHKIFMNYLKEKRFKVTPQRKVILDVFLDQEDHLTSEELYYLVREKDESVGQATVYRTLKLLVDSGLAREMHFGDGVARFELAFGSEHHDHLICERCGKNIEVVDEKIEKLQEMLAQEHGFSLTSHRMYLYGICKDCRQN